MPPVLDPENSKVDGLAFLGLSLARNHYHAPKQEEDKEGEHKDGELEPERLGHPDSYTHQEAFDLNEVIDRDYEFLQSTDDNGWLVGGGEAGPPTSYKLAALDSAHVEIMRVGTYRKDWGGLDLEELLEGMNTILVPQIEVLPTDVVANPDTPPELEIRFDMECSEDVVRALAGNDFDAFCAEPLPTNWQLRFLHNQFFRKFLFPSRFCPGAFHSTILRKADFRSDAHRTLYFAKCASAIQQWRLRGPQALNTIPRHPDGSPLTQAELEAMQEAMVEETTPSPTIVANDTTSVQTDLYVPPTKEETEAVEELVKKLESMAPLPPEAMTARATSNLEISLDEKDAQDDNQTEDDGEGEAEEPEAADVEAEAPVTEEIDVVPVFEDSVKSDPKDCHSGIWLFTDRENITHFFKPTFLPPYDTPEKRKIIFDVLKEEWHEPTLSWKPCGQGSMTQKKPEDPGLFRDIRGAITSVFDGVCAPQKPPRKQSSAVHF